MKKGWQTKTLGDVCAFDKAQGIHRGLPYVGLEHIESHTARFIGSSEPQPVKSSTFRFSDEHVLYGRLRPYLNKALAPDFEGHCSTEIFPLKPRPELSREYLLFWLLADETCDRINETCTGARMPRAQMNDVLGFEIPVPPLPEQRRIVGLLDEAFAGLATAKANAEKNLQNARALFESHLQSVFADQWHVGKLVTLSELATDITDGDHLPPPKSPTGVPFITIGNIVKETREIDFSDTFMVPRAYFDALKTYKKPRRGDVLYTVTGSFGIPVIVRDDAEFCFQRHIGLVRPKPEISSSWLYYLLMSPQLLKQANEGATGTAQKTVSLKLLRSFMVPKVAPNQQRQAVGKLDALNAETRHLAAIYSRKLAVLEALKKSLLHQAFTGEL
ncbi:MAG: restriction endonuclease subunit S [Lentisphaerae bacterium]|nr:restriction endonuclease subunit S [Lentisphaerota bacterium]